jgi:NADH-quinone oxidoreductase subunit G
MEGFEGVPPSALVTRFWYPGWNSVQAVNKFQSQIGGPLHGGDPGRRLIEPAEITGISYFSDVPAAFSSHPEELLVLPVCHIFGSEELSILSPGIAELAPKPYLGLNRYDMEQLQIKEGAEVEIIINGKPLCLPAKQITALTRGTVALPSGLPGLQGIVFPAMVKGLRLKKNMVDP